MTLNRRLGSQQKRGKNSRKGENKVFEENTV